MKEQNIEVQIRPAVDSDKVEIWNIIKAVIISGDTYVYNPDSTKEKMLSYWFAPDKKVFVATIDGKVVGTFVIRPNQIDLGSHIANASYMVDPNTHNKGIGRKMGAYSLAEAKRLGFAAMQFNYVVKSNERAVHLWQSLGFRIVGEVPNAYRHQMNGLTNILILYREL